MCRSCIRTWEVPIRCPDSQKSVRCKSRVHENGDHPRHTRCRTDRTPLPISSPSQAWRADLYKMKSTFNICPSAHSAYYGKQGPSWVERYILSRAHPQVEIGRCSAGRWNICALYSPDSQTHVLRMQEASMRQSPEHEM